MDTTVGTYYSFLDGTNPTRTTDSLLLLHPLALQPAVGFGLSN
jgi:hypothetical protein